MSTKAITIVLGAIVIGVFGYIGYQDAVRTWQHLQDQKNQIHHLDKERKKLDKELDTTKKDRTKRQEEVLKLEEEKKNLESEHQKLESERQRLEKELQAKAESKAKLAAASEQVINKATLTSTASAVAGDKNSWLAASNIPPSEYGNADWLVNKESGWNPSAVNSSSGACGLGQQLPCEKWAGQWNNPVDSLNGMHSYIISQYGSWGGAISHSQHVGWY